jgi:Ni2+-binding GTPase involved in maturation of urease and hydrogenase
VGCATLITTGVGFNGSVMADPGSSMDPHGVFTIGVAGGTGSGKTTLCTDLQHRVSARKSHERVLILHE